MAETENDPNVYVDDDDDDAGIETPVYEPPAQKTLEEIQNADADDESLVSYKQQLLGNIPAVADDPDTKNVVIEKMSLCPLGRDEIQLDFTGDLTKFKDNPITIKEGCEYQIKIIFRVRKEIVVGLRLFQDTYMNEVQVEKYNLMVGSYGPKAVPHIFTTAAEEAPKGILSLGLYIVKSKFVDVDRNNYLEWECSLDIKKDWD